ncbi:hypothetical protein LshimejAT787_1500640 [Lyophyllum shimeji]|uniref:Uncharacterized protein n=1 Tax=Lyophyllum shimeji TaxID=47721 RepID=A0A9P3PXK8_LYOSH|nr:hypothetical protein LshimejAT787_1500640 [Lyophyllum shimeji]
MLAPHVPRCKTLCYDVTFTSSLPRLATDFPNTAHHLSKLVLKASVANGMTGFLDGTEVTHFPFPVLQDLEIDGWNFVEIYTNAGWWFEELLKTSTNMVHTLAISQYRPMMRGEIQHRFLIDDAFPLLSKFRRLLLDNVDFDCTSDENPFTHNIEPESLELCSLSGPLTAAMLEKFLHVPFLTIVRCPLTDLGAFPACALTLRNIDYPAIAQDLRVLLPDWDGYELRIDNCPGFDDSILDMLGATRVLNTTTGEERLNASMLVNLSIENCHGFSIAALRRMTEARKIFIAGSTSDDLRDLTVLIRNVPTLEAEDRQWFARNFGDASLWRYDMDIWERSRICRANWAWRGVVQRPMFEICF